MIIPKQQ